MKFFFLFLFVLISCDQDLPKGGDFTIKSSTGNFDTKLYRGKVLFLFFGFLHCPHVCPTTTSSLNLMMKNLSPDKRTGVTPVFISVDPERDTPSVMRDHFSGMDRAFVPVTGNIDDVRKALSLFGGSFTVVKGKSEDDIFVDHTSTVFVVNRKGEWVNSLPYDSSAEEFRNALDTADSLPPYWSDDVGEGPVKLLGVVQDCDAGKGPCSFKHDGMEIQIAFDSYPVKHLETTALTVKVSGSPMTPIRANFLGVEQNMGLIRPRFQKDDGGNWKAKFQLPPCNLARMHWNMKVLFQDPEARKDEVRFHLSSLNSL